MSRTAACHVSACALAVAFATVWSGALPSTARAEEGIEEQLAPVTALAEAATELAGDPAAAAVPELALDEQQASAVPSDAQPVSAAVEEVADDVLPEASLPTDEPVGEAAAASGPATVPATTADTTAGSGDIVPDTPVAEVEPSPTATTVPAEPSTAAPAPAAANVNVSVRIDSPGDNGSVTQLNVAATAPVATPSVAHPLSTAADTGSASPVSSPAATTATGSATPDASGNTWYWDWDCLSAPPLTAISPTRSTDGSLPVNWLWIWNCAGNSAQYQDQTLDRYQQINANVSIRISSPGDDGSVTQVNMNIGTTPGRTEPPRPSGHPPISTVPWPIPAGIAATLAPALGLDATPIVAPTAAVMAPPLTVGGPVLDQPLLENIGQPSPAWLEPHRATAGMPAAAGFRVRRSAADRWVPATRSATTRPEPARQWIAEAIVAPTPPRTPAAEASRASGANRGATPRWRPAVPRPLAPQQSSGTSAAAAGGGASSGGGGLPFILALPFVAAVLDLARRVALERATWPPGHRRRIPDTPG